MEQSDDYLIWSNEHRAWWKTGGWGYSTGLATAGRFTKQDAMRICRDAIPTAAHIGKMSEIPVREQDLYDILRDQILPKCIMMSRE
jgi:hypothetical protein